MRRTKGTSIQGSLFLSVAAATLFGMSASAAPIAPTRAAGFWELAHIGEDGRVIETQTLCVSAASEAKTSVFGQIALNVNCSKYFIEKTGSGWSFEFVCGSAGMTSTSKGNVTGNFASTYSVDMTENDESMELKRKIHATHKGACPAGVKPGDLMNGTGQVITNILN